MEITVLCKVVDNFGDIGVSYRLVKSLVELGKREFGWKSTINLIVDDLVAFKNICSSVDIEKNYQEMSGFNVYDWKDYDFCYRAFSGENNSKLQVILEMFQCGRPDWMEKILFEDELNHTVNIIMVDYLTAEDYAETFHCLDSLTRRAKVQKVNFMPGFTEKTGGLILGENLPDKYDCDSKKVLFFCYDRAGSGWNPVVKALNESLAEDEKILVAKGKGNACFLEACKKSSAKNEVVDLPYLNQEEWDEMMKSCSFLFIRGEETLSRACLFGIPFVWHAYPQSDEYQLVKVNALLNRMERHFEPEDFAIVKKVWIDFNTPESEIDGEIFKSDVKMMVENRKKLAYGFMDFAKDLRKNGDLAVNLMTFIQKKVII